MAIERVINIVANAKQATKDIKDLFNTMLEAEIANQKLNATAEETGDVYKESSKEAVKAVDKIGDSAEKQGRVMQKLNGAVKAVGTSLKALGIGLIIALVAKFTEVLSNNQQVVDTFNKVSTTMSIIINQLFNAFSAIASKINEATGGFDALGQVVGSVVKMAFNNLKIIVYELQLAFNGLKLAYETVFGDEEGIKRAEKNLKELTKKIGDTTKDQVKQAKNIYNNIGEAVNEVVTGVTILATDGTKAISDIDVKGAYAQAEAIERNKKNFELLALQQERLVQQYEAQAEGLRQVRDDDTLAISERIKANQELSKVLDAQAQAEKAKVTQRISALQQEQALLGVTSERTNEIYQLGTELFAINNKIKGQKSEQLANENALLKEQKDLILTVSENENERRINDLKFKEEQALTEEDRINAERERLLFEQQIAKDDLAAKKLLYKEGTQARVDAEQEFLNKDQEIKNQLFENTKANNERLKNEEQALADAKLAIQNANLDNVSAGIGLLKQLGEKSKGLQKAALIAENAAGIAKTIINTVAANAKAVAASPLTGGQPFVSINSISAGIGIASSIAATAKGLKELGGGGSGGGSSAPNVGGSGGGVAAPSFNLIEGTGSNQIAEGLATERRPVQAYVVASNVSSAQELDRNAINEASL